MFERVIQINVGIDVTVLRQSDVICFFLWFLVYTTVDIIVVGAEGGGGHERREDGKGV